MTTIGSKMARGAIWMVLAKLVERSLGFVSTLILARVLMPNDFGIVAMATSFIVLLELLTAFGFDTTLIQKQSTNRDHYDTAWTFGILFGVGVAFLMVVFAEEVAGFYREPALEDVIRLLAIGSIAGGFQNIGVVAFRTEMEFNKEFAFLVGKKLLGFVTAIPLALVLRSYWALVIGQIIGRILSTGLSFAMHPYRPRLTLAGSRDLFHFSKWLLVINVIGYLRERSSDWVIGRVGGPRALGEYNIAYELASLPSSELAAPINRAVFPAYARMAASEDGLRLGYLSVMSVIALLAVPAVLGLACTAPLIVPVVLGAKWTGVTPILVILSFFGLTMLAQSNAHAAYLALGKGRLAANINIVHVIVLLSTMIPLSARYGAVGAASAQLVTAVIMIPISIYVTLRLLRLPLREFLAAIWRPLAASAGMYLVVRTLMHVLPQQTATGLVALQLAAAVVTGIVTYVVLVGVLWVISDRPAGAERMVIDRVLPGLKTVLGRFGVNRETRP